MKYFVDENTRKADMCLCYLELQKGHFNGKVWAEDSLILPLSVVTQLKLDEKFKKALGKFSLFGNYEVSREQWKIICDLQDNDNIEFVEFLNEITPWADSCFEQFDYFTILGL